MSYVAIKLNSHNSVFADTHPSECPICHHKIAPILHFAFARQEAPQIQAAYECTNTRCGRLFLATFSEPHPNPQVGQMFRLKTTLPVTQQKHIFSDCISSISPQFVLIYNEAYAAEQLELKEICGVGYRKSLEFLIKDYLIGKISPDDEKREEKIEIIKAKFLGKCIEENITDTNIKVVAKRATWLGNDETHYVRKWTDKDVRDLKKLIALTVIHMESEALTVQALAEMPEG